MDVLPTDQFGDIRVGSDGGEYIKTRPVEQKGCVGGWNRHLDLGGKLEAVGEDGEQACGQYLYLEGLEERGTRSDLRLGSSHKISG